MVQRENSTSLLNLVEVGRRFQRAVNLGRDTGSPNALDGYLVTPAVRRALVQIANGLDNEDGDRAWSLVGPYGSGKSAFAVFLADLLSPSDSAAARTARRLLKGSNEVPVPAQALYPSVLTAERAPLDTLLLKSLDTTLEGIWRHQRGRKPQVLQTVKRYLNGSAPSLSRCATSDVVSCFEEAVQTIADKTGAGLLLIVDEAGKALEYAAQQPTRGDVYLLQALAETAARSNGVPFVVLTVLHQSFDQYAHQLGSSDRNEWAKVQGRFGELAFREGGDQIIRLTASAIRRTARWRAPPGWNQAVSSTAAWVSEGTGWNQPQLTRHLNACWPLHPVTTALLGPLFRGRLAQNERSLFAFLTAGEPLSFRDYLRTHGRGQLYTVDRLYDYAMGMLGSRMLSRDGRQWAEIDTAIKRLPAESDGIDEQVLKTVGLLGMLGDQVGLRASAEVVATCIEDGNAADEALERLRQRSILVYRQFRDAFQIWEGSDLDLDELVFRAGQSLPASFSVAAALQQQRPRAPLVARRHLFQTGTLRYFDLHFVDASRLLQHEPLNLEDEGDGIVVLTLPRTEKEAEDLVTKQVFGGLAIERAAGGKPVVLVVPETLARLSELAHELAASRMVHASTPELQSDPTARSELNGRIEELERQLAAEVGRAFAPERSAWYTAEARLDIKSWRDAAGALSTLCDEHFRGAPPIKNELLNRRALSTSAARARRNLIEAMIRRGDAEQLGFTGNPPEVSMYRSVLEVHGLHRRRDGELGFGAPKRPLQRLWKEVDRFLADTEAGRHPLSELYDRLRQPPFGVKDGPLPIIVMAALLAREDEVAIYERGSFMPAWTPSHAERLLRSPDGFEVRQCHIDGVRRDVFQRLAGTLRSSAKRDPSLLDVVRGLVRFIAVLPPYARRTQHVSEQALGIREALVRAREPAQLVFNDLPAACGHTPFGISQSADRKRTSEFVETLQAGLREIQNTYPALLERACAALAHHLSLPSPQAELTAELRTRAGQIRELAVDPVLRSFVVRAADDALGQEDYLTSLLTQLADKPPVDWSDADEEQFQVRLARVARTFRGAESLLVGIDGATDEQALVRLAVARRGGVERERVLPLRACDQSRISDLRNRILHVVKSTGAGAAAAGRDVALTALALAAESLIGGSRPEKRIDE